MERLREPVMPSEDLAKDGSFSVGRAVLIKAVSWGTLYPNLS